MRDVPFSTFGEKEIMRLTHHLASVFPLLLLTNGCCPKLSPREATIPATTSSKVADPLIVTASVAPVAEIGSITSVDAIITLENIGAGVCWIVVSDNNSYDWDVSCTFEGHTVPQKPSFLGKSAAAGRIASCQPFGPGACISDRLDLRNIFPFRAPGEYIIRFERPVGIDPMSPSNIVEQVSAQVTLKVIERNKTGKGDITHKQ